MIFCIFTIPALKRLFSALIISYFMACTSFLISYKAFYKYVQGLTGTLPDKETSEIMAEALKIL